MQENLTNLYKFISYRNRPRAFIFHTFITHKRFRGVRPLSHHIHRLFHFIFISFFKLLVYLSSHGPFSCKIKQHRNSSNPHFYTLVPGLLSLENSCIKRLDLHTLEYSTYKTTQTQVSDNYNHTEGNLAISLKCVQALYTNLKCLTSPEYYSHYMAHRPHG